MKYSFLVLAICFFASCGNIKSSKVSTEAANNETDNSSLKNITLPQGFSIEVYADIPDARSLCISPAGIVFAGNKSGNKVYAITDTNKDGKADSIYVIASGMNTPNGVAFKDGDLYIATISTIYKLNNIEAHLSDPPQPVKVYDQYPTDRMHGWKFIAFGPDGKLYIPVGSPCNICENKNPVYASITRINADGTGMEVFANGIRNTVGFAWHPDTKQLWFTENGGDNLGDDKPNDELNTAPQKGLNFGYPYCHQGNFLDPEFGTGKNCANYTPPVKLLGPHVAALGMRFYTGNMFPAEYKNAIFIAQHGSWNRSKAIGYRVVVAKQDANGNVADPVPFAEGWLTPNGNVNGRPVDVQVMPDGALLVSDDFSGKVYRISYKKL